MSQPPRPLKALATHCQHARATLNRQVECTTSAADRHLLTVERAACLGGKKIETYLSCQNSLPIIKWTGVGETQISWTVAAVDDGTPDMALFSCFVFFCFFLFCFLLFCFFVFLLFFFRQQDFSFPFLPLPLGRGAAEFLCSTAVSGTPVCEPSAMAIPRLVFHCVCEFLQCHLPRRTRGPTGAQCCSQK